MFERIEQILLSLWIGVNLSGTTLLVLPLIKDSLNLNRGHLVPFIVVLLTEIDFGVLPELGSRLWTNGIVDGDALLSLNKGTSNGTWVIQLNYLHGHLIMPVPAV